MNDVVIPEAQKWQVTAYRDAETLLWRRHDAHLFRRPDTDTYRTEDELKRLYGPLTVVSVDDVHALVADVEFARTEAKSIYDTLKAIERERDTLREVAQSNKRHVAYQAEYCVKVEDERDEARAQLAEAHRCDALCRDVEEDRDRLLAALTALKEAGTDPGLLRWCEWPGCWRSFNAVTGPGEHGWKYARTGGTTLLCPPHAASGHVPGYDTHPEEGWKVAGTCECGARGEAAPSNGNGIVAWWSGHVATLNGVEEYR